VLGGVALGDVVLGAAVLGEGVELGDDEPLVPVAPGVLEDPAAPIVGLASTNDGDAVAAPAAEADCSPACTQPVTITICALPADAEPDCVSDCAAAPAPSAIASAPAKKTCLVMIPSRFRMAEPLRRLIYASGFASYPPLHLQRVRSRR